MGATAKDKHRIKLVEHLANPDNDFPNREGLALVCGISKVTMYAHFTPDELTEIEKEGLALRRSKYSVPLSKIDKALIKKAEEGDAQAIKLAYQKFEGWSEKSKHEHTGKDGGPIETTYNINFVKEKV